MFKSLSDVVGGAISITLGIVLMVWLIPEWVEPDPDLRLTVSLVPQIVAIGFVICGAALLLKTVIASRRTAKPSATQSPGINRNSEATSGFQPAEFRGLVLMILMLIAATIAFQHVHFLIVAPVIVALSMWMFGPIRPLSLVLTASIGPLAIWVLATQVLGRVVP